jgi:hypothetical protein
VKTLFIAGHEIFRTNDIVSLLRERLEPPHAATRASHYARLP